MKVLITGSKGQLGSQICETLSEKFGLIPTSRRGGVLNDLSISKLDITDHEKTGIFIRRTKPDIIINCAAMTNVDDCEENPRLAKKINTDAVLNLVKICSRLNIKLIQISTDYVFDGKEPPYSEISSRNPIQVYGKSKSDAEDHVTAESGLDWAIVRASGIFSTTHHNFLTWVIDSENNNGKILLACDQFSTPISARSVSRFIQKIIELDLSGVWNIGSEEKLSRFDFARIVSEKFSIKDDRFTRSTMISMPWKAQRPVDTSFNTSKMRGVFEALDIQSMIGELASYISEKPPN